LSSGGTCAVLLQDTGFFLVSDHGIEDNVIDEAFQKAKSALDLPDTVKKNYPFSLDRYVGWRGLDELQSVTGELSLTRSNVPPAMIIMSRLNCNETASSQHLGHGRVVTSARRLISPMPRTVLHLTLHPAFESGMRRAKWPFMAPLLLPVYAAEAAPCRQPPLGAVARQQTWSGWI